MSGPGFLLVRCGAERLGVALASVEEVLDLPPPVPVPGRLRSFRGVVRWRGRHLSVLHLGALLANGAPPQERGESAVVVRLGGRPVALEVDAVEDVIGDGGARVGAPPTAAAAGVFEVEGTLVTLLDLAGLAERIEATGGSDEPG